MKRFHSVAVAFVGLTVLLGWSLYDRGPRADRSGARGLESVLAEVHGAQWPILRARLSTEQQALLNREVLPGELPPWETVAPELRQKLREGLQSQRDAWAERFRSVGELELDGAALNPEHKLLGLHDARSAQSIIDVYQPELDTLIAASFDLTVEADEAIWDEGAYRAWPFIEFPDPDPPRTTGRFVFTQKWVQYPWIVSYTIDSGHWSELNTTVARMSELRARRGRDLREFIRKLQP